VQEDEDDAGCHGYQGDGQGDQIGRYFAHCAIVYFGQFWWLLSKIAMLFFHKKISVNFDKKWLGYISGYFFTNSPPPKKKPPELVVLISNLLSSHLASSELESYVRTGLSLP
jgi:hypothetical protein